MTIAENKKRLDQITSIEELKVSIDKLKVEDAFFEKHYKKYINIIDKYEKLNEKIKALKKYEETKKLDYDYVIGIDEVGRGPLAGPVVATAIMMKSESYILDVDDSKKLSEKVRESIFDEIKNDSLCLGIGMIDANKIDEINILNATFMAMKQAFDELHISNDKKILILIDGNLKNPYINYENVVQESIIKGDGKCYSIACASIIAKVTRDRIMNEFDKTYPNYDFINNKGYGTSKHLDGIKSVGIIEGIHRKSFLKEILRNM